MIQPCTSVVDLCAGTSLLYDQLKDKNVGYTAIDINPVLVKKMVKQNINAVEADITKANIPEADTIVMCSSLYHFGDKAAETVRKMLRSARTQVIILEPVKHVSNSRIKFFAKLARRASRIDGVVPMDHFDNQRLSKVLHSVPGLQLTKVISGGRDILAVYSKDSR